MKTPVFFCAVLGAFLLAALNAFAQEQTPAPNFQEGDFWHFKATEKHLGVSRSDPLDGIYEVVYSKGKVKISELKGDQKAEADEKRRGHFLELLGLRKEYETLKFPLFVGQKWNYDYEARAVGAKRERRVTVEIAVTGTDQVTTPAGSFRAFKIESTHTGGKQSWVSTYYYSPETKSVIKSSYDSTAGSGMGTLRQIELIKFGSIRKPPIN